MAGQVVLNENLEKIRSMAGSQRDWNGSGGQPFSDKAIRLFMDVLAGLKVQPQIAPTGRGSLLLQYELDDSSILAFELSESSLSQVYVPARGFRARKRGNTS